MLAAYAAKQPPGVWLTDGAWDHEQWSPPRLPTKALLDPATGDRPACFQRQDGHMMVCNSLALKLSGIDRKTPDPAGRRHRARRLGRADRGPEGRGDEHPLPGPPGRARKAEIVAGLRAAVAHAREERRHVRAGPAGRPAMDLPAWDEIRRSGDLTVRVNYRPSITDWPGREEGADATTGRTIG